MHERPGNVPSITRLKKLKPNEYKCFRNNLLASVDHVRTLVWQGSAGDRRPYADCSSHGDLRHALLFCCDLP